MTFDDELMVNYIPHNVQIDFSLKDNLNLEVKLNGKKDGDLLRVAEDAKKYYEEVIRKVKFNDIGRKLGVLFKVPIRKSDSEDISGYYLHIFGDYEIEEIPITPLKMLRSYVKEKTNSPKIFWNQVGEAYGWSSDRIPVKLAKIPSFYSWLRLKTR